MALTGSKSSTSPCSVPHELGCLFLSPCALRLVKHDDSFDGRLLSLPKALVAEVVDVLDQRTEPSDKA